MNNYFIYYISLLLLENSLSVKSEHNRIWKNIADLCATRVVCAQNKFFILKNSRYSFAENCEIPAFLAFAGCICR